MEPKAFVFDFDGTLVHSNSLKREAFYSLAEVVTQNREIVDRVLSSMPEASRYEIIDEIYGLIGKANGSSIDPKDITGAVKKYNRSVREGILACPELRGATELLCYLHQRGKGVFISSNTPEEFMQEHIVARKWDHLIDGFFGFPKKKSDTLRYLLHTRQLNAAEILVVGDGASDENSAKVTGCPFYRVENDDSIIELDRALRSKQGVLQ